MDRKTWSHLSSVYLINAILSQAFMATQQILYKAAHHPASKMHRTPVFRISKTSQINNVTYFLKEIKTVQRKIFTLDRSNGFLLFHVFASLYAGIQTQRSRAFLPSNRRQPEAQHCTLTQGLNGTRRDRCRSKRILPDSCSCF